MERSSPSRTAGVVMREVKLGDQSFLLSKPYRVRKAADEEAVIIARRLDMFPALARACASLPAEERDAWRREYINAMLCGIASPQEWMAYSRSLWDLAFKFWHTLDPKHKIDPTDEKGKLERSLLDGVAWAYELVTALDRTTPEMDALELAVKIVGQEQILGESSGSAEAATPPTDNQSTADGQPSSTTSSNEAGA